MFRRLNESKRSVKIRATIYVIVAAYVLLSFLNVIPYSQPVSYTLSFGYAVGGSGPFSLILWTTLSAKETIAENVPVTISNVVGTMTHVLSENVTSATICFDGASFSGLPPVGYKCAGTPLLETNWAITGLPITLDGPSLVGQDITVEWQVEGDYYAILTLYLRNGSALAQAYPQDRIHVEPASVLTEEKNSQNIQALEVAGFVFGLTWLISLVEHKLGEPAEYSISRLTTNSKQETKASSNKNGSNYGRNDSQKRGVQKEHHNKTRKQHQPATYMNKEKP